MSYLNPDLSAPSNGKRIKSSIYQTAALLFFGFLLISQFAQDADESMLQPWPEETDVQQPIQQTEAAAIPVTADDGRSWHGVMACDARQDSGRNIPGYQARFEMEKDGNTVTIHRQNENVVEKLQGKVADDILNLFGTGYRIAEPKKKWQFSFSAEFPPGATMFSGKGNMIAGGDPIRSCELIMTRSRQPEGRMQNAQQGVRPRSGSRFSQLRLGMTIKQVTDLIGPPKDTDSHESGKRWIPFYFGNDARRLEALYENEGCLVFASGNIFGANAEGELKEIQPNPSGACFKNPSYDPKRQENQVSKK